MIHKVLEVCRKLPLKIVPTPNLMCREFLCVATGGTRATQQGPLLGPGPGRKLCSLWEHTASRKGSRKKSEAHRRAQTPQGRQISSIGIFTQVFSISRITLERTTWRLTTRFAPSSFFQRGVFATESLTASFPKLFEGLVLITLNAKFQYHVWL